MDKELGYYFKRISNRLEAGKNQALKMQDITGTQLDILFYIAKNEGHNQLCEISDFFGVQHTSTLHVIKSLEKKELILRADLDKRTHGRQIQLTQKGKQLVEENEHRCVLANQIMAEGFSEEERGHLLDYLKRVSENIEKRNVEEI